MKHPKILAELGPQLLLLNIAKPAGLQVRLLDPQDTRIRSPMQFTLRGKAIAVQIRGAVSGHCPWSLDGMNARPLHSGSGGRISSGIAAVHAKFYGSAYRALERVLPAGWPLHTSTLCILSAGSTLNLLAICNALWRLGLFSDPYNSSISGKHVLVWAVIFVAVEANVLLARRVFHRQSKAGEGQRQIWAGRHVVLYFIGSLVVFAFTYSVAQRGQVNGVNYSADFLHSSRAVMPVPARTAIPPPRNHFAP